MRYMIEAIKYSLSIFIAFLTMGGAFYTFTIDTLKENETKKKVIRLMVGLTMFVSGIVMCYYYKEYAETFWTYARQSWGWK